ncbi:hypothetical protein PR048_027370 [Dryococelus australis]|uniref:Uncharacterized protein n=1 Tax=Dryococelus australis TaxID=614101 RepID=A0ABQ9GGN3_9NEOP|nr:hypothetical protein PR048_027370 [Dryococelus australis]
MCLTWRWSAEGRETEKKLDGLRERRSRREDLGEKISERRSRREATAELEAGPVEGEDLRLVDAVLLRCAVNSRKPSQFFSFNLRVPLQFYNAPGAAVGQRLERSPSAKANTILDFRTWASCQMMTIVLRFTPGSPVSSALAFRRCSILTLLNPRRLLRPRCQEPPLVSHRSYAQGVQCFRRGAVLCNSDHIAGGKLTRSEVDVGGVGVARLADDDHARRVVGADVSLRGGVVGVRVRLGGGTVLGLARWTKADLEGFDAAAGRVPRRTPRQREGVVVIERYLHIRHRVGNCNKQLVVHSLLLQTALKPLLQFYLQAIWGRSPSAGHEVPGGSRWSSGQTSRFPPRRPGLESRAGMTMIFARGKFGGRCRWSVGFLGDLPFHPNPSLHYGAAPYSPRFTLIGSQDLAVKSRPNISTHCRSWQYTGPVAQSKKRHHRECAYPIRYSRKTPSTYGNNFFVWKSDISREVSQLHLGGVINESSPVTTASCHSAFRRSISRHFNRLVKQSIITATRQVDSVQWQNRETHSAFFPSTTGHLQEVCERGKGGGGVTELALWSHSPTPCPWTRPTSPVLSAIAIILHSPSAPCGGKGEIREAVVGGRSLLREFSSSQRCTFLTCKMLPSSCENSESVTSHCQRQRQFRKNHDCRSPYEAAGPAPQAVIGLKLGYPSSSDLLMSASCRRRLAILVIPCVDVVTRFQGRKEKKTGSKWSEERKKIYSEKMKECWRKKKGQQRTKH